jgi:hypothetical protein
MSYFKNVLVLIDQLGNALCGSNPDNTISARVGYFSEVKRGASKYFWKGLAKIINFTFWPIDGLNHCRQAFEADPEEAFNDDNGDVFRELMSIIIVGSCIPISIILYSVWTVKKIF